MTIANRQKTSYFIAILICSLASLFYVYDYFIQVAPSVMTTELMQAFNIGAGKLGLLSACFYYSYTIMQIPAGILLDRFGARKLLSFAIFISAVGVLLFAQAHSLSVAGMARFLVGFGSAFSFIGSLFLISHWFSHRNFAFIAGLVQLGASVGSIFGLAPLAWVISHYGWRHSMWVAGLMTCLFALVVFAIVRDSPNHSRNKLLKSVDKKERHHKTRKDLLILLANKQLWIVALCGVVCWVPVAVIGALWGVPYLIKIYHISTIDASKMISLFWIALALGSPFLGWYSNYISRRKRLFILCFSLGFIGASLLLFAVFLPLWVSAIALFLSGLSVAMQSLSFGVVKDIVPHSSFATASGLNNMAAIIGGGISQPIVGFLLYLFWNGALVHGVPDYSIANYLCAFSILPVSAIIGLVLSCLWLKETYCKQQAEA